MTPLVSIIMGSTSDMPIMEAAAKFLNDNKIPFEINALSAHRTPEEAKEFAMNAHKRGVKVVIAAAGLAAHLPGVISAFTPLPVIGVPINASNSINGLDAVYAILQMPPGIPVATVGINAAQNAAILATQIIGTGNPEVQNCVVEFKENMKNKIKKANEDLSQIKFDYKTN